MAPGKKVTRFLDIIEKAICVDAMRMYRCGLAPFLLCVKRGIKFLFEKFAEFSFKKRISALNVNRWITILDHDKVCKLFEKVFCFKM